MTGARGRSAFVAAVFALHPLHVESVAWVSERKDVLSGLFFMLALCAYAWHAERPRIARLLVVTLCLLLGLLSKPTLVTLAVRCSCCSTGGRSGGSPALAPSGPGVRVSLRRAVLEKIPMFLLVAAVASIIFVVGRAAGAMSSLEVVPLGARVSNALESYVLYAAKSFWPSGLAVIYPLARRRSRRCGRASRPRCCSPRVSALVARHARARPYLAVGWLWYLGMLVPTIGLVQVGEQARADRFMYLPLIGLSIMVAWGACDLLDRLRARRFAAARGARRRSPLSGSARGSSCGTGATPSRCSSTPLAVTRAERRRPSAAGRRLSAQRAMPTPPSVTTRRRPRSIPSWAPARLGLADVRAWRGDLAGAIAAYERELRSTSERPAGRRPLRPRAAAGGSRRGSACPARDRRRGAPRFGDAARRARRRLRSSWDARGMRSRAIEMRCGSIRGQRRAANNLAWLLATARGRVARRSGRRRSCWPSAPRV